ncbi:CMRF35-like molecule 8 [Pimephales promelas]|uniref:CMRF35-like molecule 8 n=1 Tax=Pimephales promelas TaxID=90988 RepID=UPI00195583B9|nr:CMRF35-like molecule 8 [Pimephales promelas]KAG1955791.1 polymeric immunoglobulin receptor-like [Pimephales promelas]
MMQICDHKLIFLLLIMSVLACETTEISTFTGYEGGQVEIRCPYESEYETYEKYLCRGECPILIKDKVVESGSPAKDERFSLTDHRTTHIFTVTITDLRTADEGQYWCGVKTALGKYDDKTEILLQIKPVSVVSGVTGHHLNISCRYNRDVNNNIKFMCKGSDPSICETSAVKVSSQTNSNGRFSLRDDESAGVFTVTVTELTLEDSGIYWCGAGETRLKNKWISVMHLNINGDFSKMSHKPISTSSDHHMTKQATKDSSSIRRVTSTTSSLPPSSSSSSHTSDSSLSPQLKLVNIMSTIMGILMVFGLSVIIYFGLRHKRQGVWMKGVVHFSSETLLTEDATLTICHYEEMMCTNTRAGFSLGLPVFGEHNASDSLTYSTVIFQTTDHSDWTSVGQELNENISL